MARVSSRFGRERNEREMKREWNTMLRYPLWEQWRWDRAGLGRWGLEPVVLLPLGEFWALADRLVRWGESGV